MTHGSSDDGGLLALLTSIDCLGIRGYLP